MRKRLGEEPTWYASGGHRAEGGTTETTMTRGTGEVGRTELLTTTRATVTGLAPVAAPRQDDAAASTERTAEIPVVRGPGPLPRSPVELSDGTLWYPGVSRRLPAPFGLRLAVWLLLFALLVGLGGLAVERYHPDWISFLRYTGASTPGATPVPTGSTAAGGSTGSAAGFRLESVTSAGSNYSVPTSSYSLVITFSHPCWAVVASPAGSSTHLVEQTLTTSESPKVIPVQGSATVDLGAAATSIAVVSGNRTLGTVKAPRAGTNYNFLPTS